MHSGDGLPAGGGSVGWRRLNSAEARAIDQHRLARSNRVTAIRQLIIGVQYVENARLGGHHRRCDALTHYAGVQDFNCGGGLIGGLPRNLKVDLLLAIHVVDREQRGR